MADPKPENDQDARQGGYGGSTGGQNPAPQRGSGSSSATGRNDSVQSPVDADEALGNRTGGYGGNPPATSDQPDGANG